MISMRYRLAATLFFLAVVSLLSTSFAADDHIVISRFAEKDLSGWQAKEFDGWTEYLIVEDEAQGAVLKATSAGAASGLIKEQQIDLTATPYLKWSWKVESLPEVEDEKTKAGDDYGARVYVIFQTGPFFWNTRALNYVWNSTYPVGEAWPNAFTDKAWVLALRSDGPEVGLWVQETRNVKEDIRRCFGLDIDTLQGIAIMTDADNSGGKAAAYYGDLFFTDR